MRGVEAWKVSVAAAKGTSSSKERCPPIQKSRVERLKAKVEPLLTYVTAGFTRILCVKGYLPWMKSPHLKGAVETGLS